MSGEFSLRDFIRQALLDIIGGIQDAQEEVAGTPVRIVPGYDDPTKPVIGSGARLEPIEFDVALSRLQGDKSSRGIGVFLATLAGGNISSEEAAISSTASRLRFRVPVLLPRQEQKDE